MNNPFDPAQLGGNMRGIAGSKLFAKALPKKDTASLFVYGKRAEDTLPLCPACGTGKFGGKCKVPTNNATIQSGINGQIIDCGNGSASTTTTTTTIFPARMRSRMGR